MSEMEAAEAAEAGNDTGDDLLREELADEEEEGGVVVKPDPDGSPAKAASGVSVPRRQTRFQSGIVVPKKAWPVIKPRRYKRRKRARNRDVEEQEDDGDYVEGDEEEEDGDDDVVVKEEGDDDEEEDEDQDEEADIDGDDDIGDVDFQPEWQKGDRLKVPKRYRHMVAGRVVKPPERKRRRRRRRRRDSSGAEDGEDDAAKESRARRRGMSELQCPGCGYRSPLVQFIKRHWISTHSPDAQKSRDRHEFYRQRKREQGVVGDSRVRAYSRAAAGPYVVDEDGPDETVEEGMAREAAFFRSLEFADDPEKPFRCDQCPFRSKYQTGLRQHQQKVHFTRRQIAFSQLTEQEKQLVTLVILLDAGGETKETYRCRNCEYQSASKEDALSHAANRQCKTDGKTYRCKKCHYKANSKNQLRGHVNFQHGGVGY